MDELVEEMIYSQTLNPGDVPDLVKFKEKLERKDWSELKVKFMIMEIQQVIR